MQVAMTIVMGRKAQLKKTKKIDKKEEAKIVAVFREVPATSEELRCLVEDKDSLALSFIQHAMDETIMCKVEKDTTSKESWKILEA